MTPPTLSQPVLGCTGGTSRVGAPRPFAGRVTALVLAETLQGEGEVLMFRDLLQARRVPAAGGLPRGGTSREKQAGREARPHAVLLVAGPVPSYQ